MMTRPQILALACGLCLSVVGCGDDSEGDDDTNNGTTGADTGADTMAPTTMSPDTGTPDTGTPDTGADTSMMDTGMTDTGMNDTGMNDTGMTDTGDTGMTDTGGAALPAVLNITGYDPHDGQDIHIKVFDDADMEVGTLDGTVMPMATFTIDDAVVDGGTYTVRWWVDLMDNDMCDPQPVDHMWELTGLTADDMGLTIDHPHDAMWTDVCASWN